MGHPPDEPNPHLHRRNCLREAVCKSYQAAAANDHRWKGHPRDDLAHLPDGNLHLESLLGLLFFKASVFEETRAFDKVPAVVFFQINTDDTGKHSLTSDSSETFSRTNNPTNSDDYYDLKERILKNLANRNLLPAEPAKTFDGFPDLDTLIHQSGMLDPWDGKYDSWSKRSGVAVQALDKSGSPFLFIGLRGGQISNDHCPFYEILLRGNKDSSEFNLIRSQVFYFDVAGMEGTEWPVIWLYIVIPGIVIGLLIVGILRLLWNCINKRPSTAS